jgi:hypothetical protein
MLMTRPLAIVILSAIGANARYRNYLLETPVVSPMHSYEVLEVFTLHEGNLGAVVRDESAKTSFLSCSDKDKYITNDVERSETLKRVMDAPWTPSVLEVFNTTKNISCVAIEPTTFVLSEIRTESSGEWPLAFVASVGIKLIDILIDMRFKYNVSQMTTPALQLPDLDEIILVDPVMIHSGQNDEGIQDLRNYARLTIRLHHGPNGGPPSDNDELWNAVLYAESLKTPPTIDDYKAVRGYYEKILTDMDIIYQGKVIGGAGIAKEELMQYKAGEAITTTTKAAAGRLSWWLPITGILAIILF